MEKNSNKPDGDAPNSGKTPDPRQVPQKPNQEKESMQEGSFRNAKETGGKEELGSDHTEKKEDDISSKEARNQPENHH